MASVLRGSGDSSFGGNLSIEGVLTYEDVASVDSVGVITARSGLHVTSGSVGIGTDNPVTTLHVDGTATVDRIINATTSSDPWLKGVNGSGTETSFIKQDGQGYLTELGIGIKTPAQLLHLTSSGSNAFIQFNDSGSGGSAAQVRIGSNGNDLVVLNNTSSNTAIERLRITSGGLVGVGTAGGSSSSTRFVVYEESGNGQTIEVKAANTGGAGSQPGIRFTAPNNDNIGAVYGDVNSDSLQFSTGTTERLRITSDGKIILKPGADSGNILQLNGADTTSEILEAGITSGHVQFTATHASGGSNTCGFIFRTRTGASGTTEKLRLTSDGKLILSMTQRTTPHGAQGDGAMFVEQSYDGNLYALMLRNKDTGASAATSLGFSLNRSGGDTDFESGKISLVKEQAWTTSSSTVDSALTFSTAANQLLGERVRITSSTDGVLLIGTTSNSNSSNVGVKISGGGGATVNVVTNAASNINLNHVYNINPTRNGYRYYLSIDGGIRNFSDSNVNLSDEREKKNITDMNSTWNDLKAWNLRQFHRKEQEDSEDKRYGVIAQQIETISPQVLSVFETGPTTIRKGVKEQQMMWMAIKALQEAQSRIETLESEVAELRGD